jgi:hypothetical protein
MRSLLNRRFIILLALWSVIIHLLFIWQMSMAVPLRGLILHQYRTLFRLHAYFIYFLPPDYPITAHSINYRGVVWKAVDAFPASLIYGAAIALVLDQLLAKLPQHQKRQHENRD